MHDELTTTPIPCPPVLFGGRRQRKLGLKLSLGRRRGRRKVFLRFAFISHYSTLI